MSTKAEQAKAVSSSVQDFANILSLVIQHVKENTLHSKSEAQGALDKRRDAANKNGAAAHTSISNRS